MTSATPNLRIPEHVAELIRTANSLFRKWKASIGLGLDVQAASIFEERAALVERLREWTVSPEGIAFRAAADERNAQVRGYIDGLLREKQARLNRAEAEAVRAAACPSCFATHAGQC